MTYSEAESADARTNNFKNNNQFQEDDDDVFVEPIKVSKPKSKRDDLLEGLNYLKSKKIKTVKEKFKS